MESCGAVVLSFGVGNFWRGVQHFLNALSARGCCLKHVAQLGEVAQRLEELSHVGQEDGQRANCQRACWNGEEEESEGAATRHVGAYAYDDGSADCHQDSHNWRELGL